jgi:hypothetical protein
MAAGYASHRDAGSASFAWSPRRRNQEPDVFPSPVEFGTIGRSATDGKRYAQYVFVVFESLGRSCEMAVPAIDAKLVQEAFARSKATS